MGIVSVGLGIVRGGEYEHRHCDEGAHGTGIVVSRETGVGGGEVAGDVEMGALGAEAGTAGVVILEYGKEGRLVANVCDILVVQEIQSLHEARWSTVKLNQSRLISRHITALC